MFKSTEKILDAAGNYFFQQTLKNLGIRIGPHWEKGKGKYNA